MSDQEFDDETGEECGYCGGPLASDGACADPDCDDLDEEPAEAGDPS